MTSISDLLAAMEVRGIVLFIDADGRLRHRGPKGAMTPDLKRDIAVHQATLIVAMRGIGAQPSERTDTKAPETSNLSVPTVPHGKSFVMRGGRRFASIDQMWESTGYFPSGPPIVRDGVRHKQADCTSRESWRHIHQGRICSGCWPCTDSLAMAKEIANG